MTIHDLIACPYCRARVDESCRTPAGNPRTPHACRLTPKLCACGAPLKPGHRYCPRCAETARRDTYRRREIRTPTRKRRRQKEAT